ncbi:MAG: hypothetical protein Q6K55_01510 [Thermostichus sp. DG02_3_bins_51]
MLKQPQGSYQVLSLSAEDPLLGQQEQGGSFCSQGWHDESA